MKNWPYSWFTVASPKRRPANQPTRLITLIMLQQSQSNQKATDLS